MKEIILVKGHFENFKKFVDVTIDFGESGASIFARNYVGKSSVADSFSWLMFNKSSTGNTEGSHFRPRRYDENGVNVDHVDVVVEWHLLVDGEPLKIKRVQRQDWVRHRGDDFDSYMGDTNIYEWNDVPVTPSEHKKKVEEIVSEKVFRMLSNPAAFPSLSAKEQREFLITNIANITDSDVFESSSEFEDVKTAMGKNTLDELAAKTKKEIAAYKKKVEELPIRIDQESKRIEDVDFSEKEKELAELQSKLADNEAKLEDAGKSYEKLNDLKAEKVLLDGELIKIKGRVDSEYESKRQNLKKAVDDASRDFTTCFEKQTSLESAVKVDNRYIEDCQKDLAEQKELYKAEMQKVLDEDAYICPTCGQEIPEEQKEKVKAEFDQKKAAKLESINRQGSYLNEEIKKTTAGMEERQNEIEDLKKRKMDAMANKNVAMEQLTAFESNPVDYESDSEFVATKKKIAALEEQISKIDTSNADAFKDALKMERAEIQTAMDSVKESLALKTVIEKSKAVVKELQAEMVQVTQSLANCEKLESQIEKFIKAKMDMLSSRINGKFKVVKWKLFEQQKNGKFAETCVCMVNGSCYGENTTSTTERMMAGMDIISTLQEIYDIKAPIFLDDADLYNVWNIPDMDCQLIKLCVSSDEELRIEVE